MTMRSTIRNVAARTATVGARRRDAYEEMQRRARLANDVPKLGTGHPSAAAISLSTR